MNGTSSVEPFRVLVVDDDRTVLQISDMVLKRLTVDGRRLSVELCSSAGAARTRLAAERYAVAIVDVVMESDHAGLDLIRDMRDDPRHQLTQVIVRTGQAGSMVEASVVERFRINDFWSKEDLPPQRMRTTVAGLLRTFAVFSDLEEVARSAEARRQEAEVRALDNLRLVSSLLDQRGDGAGSDAALKENAQRVASMAIVQEHLLRTRPTEPLELAALARDLVEHLRGALAPALAVTIEGAAVIPRRRAIAFGLLVHELTVGVLGEPAAGPLALACTPQGNGLVLELRRPNAPAAPLGPSPLVLDLAQEAGGHLQPPGPGGALRLWVPVAAADA